VPPEADDKASEAVTGRRGIKPLVEFREKAGTSCSVVDHISPASSLGASISSGTTGGSSRPINLTSVTGPTDTRSVTIGNIHFSATGSVLPIRPCHAVIFIAAMLPERMD
jgi:hypothetical protein